MSRVQSLESTTPIEHTPRRARAWGALPFVLPALLIYGIFVIYPILNTFVLSLYKWDGISPEREFVGLANFIALASSDEVFWRAFRNSGVWVILSLIVPTTLGLGMALAVDQRLIGRSFFRTIFYLPAVLASIAVATMWSWMYNPSLGIINAILRGLGLSAWIQDWLGNRDIALYSVFVASVWQSVGVNMVLFLAGLQTVPHDLTEAARVDGANRLQVFRNVTIPCLRGTFVVVISLTIINSLKVFDLIYGMTYGGPGQSTHVLATWSIFNAIQLRDFGSGMAIAIVLLALTLLIVVPYLRWANRDEVRV